MKAIEKKSAIESLCFEVKDFATKNTIILKQNGVIFKSFSNIHSAYKSVVK